MPNTARPIRRKARHDPRGPGRAAAGARAKVAAPPDVALGARRHPLVNEVERQLRRCGVFDDAAAEQRLVIGVSGGADSVALLLACLVISQRVRPPAARFVPMAVHVHHHLRPSADGDAAWVVRLCKRLGVDCDVEHVQPGDLAGNAAANARMLRYEALAHSARRVGAAYVAVAHHGEDQLETMLIAMCRGAGLDGLAGMAWSRPLWCGVTLLRPMLAATKEDCEDLCRKAGIRWRRDPTNVDPRRLRARLRRDVIPVLESLWPDIGRRITATADVVCAARGAFERQIEAAFGPPTERAWDRLLLMDLPESVLAAGLRRAALDAAPAIGEALNQRHLLTAAAAITSDEHRPKRFDWPGGLVVAVGARRVELSREASNRRSARRSAEE